METGLQKCVCKTYQESSIKLVVDEALRQTGKSGTFEPYEAVPEYNALGDSASDSRAERAVPTIEDQLWSQVCP